MSALIKEITDALRNSGAPMTSTELVPHCPSAVKRADVSRAVYQMRKEGLIVAIKTRKSHEGKGGRQIAAYELAESADPQWVKPPDIDGHLAEYAAMPVDDVLESVRDETTEMMMDDTTATDPILDEIARMVWRLPNADLHAGRLRSLSAALSEQADDGRQATLLTLWLEELADLISPPR